jgi:hypothetical protein
MKRIAIAMLVGGIFSLAALALLFWMVSLWSFGP